LINLQREIKKTNFIKKTKKKLKQSWLTWLTYYPRYKIMTTQKKSAANNQVKALITKYQLMN
jgi:hypothetical protein